MNDKQLKSIRGFILLLLLGFSNISWSQQIELAFHHLTEENGLTYADQFHLSMDKKGLLWIGTDNGLLKFNGKKITKYRPQKDREHAISESRITSSCFEDSEENLWFTSSKSINCYRRKSDDFIAFQLENTNKVYRAFHLTSDGKLWLQVGTGKAGALYIFDISTKTFEQKIPLEGELCTPVFNKDGEISQLLSTSLPNQSGLIWTELESGKTQLIEFQKTTKGVKRRFPSPTKNVAIEEDSTVWVGVYNGLGKYRLGQKEGLVEMERASGIDADVGWVWDIIPYDKFRLFVAATNGLLIFDKKTGQFIQQFRYKANDSFSLKLNQTNKLFIDPLKNLWVSGPQQELAFANLEKHRFSKLPSTAYRFINNITEDAKGKIWCSTPDSGTYVHNQNREVLFRSTDFIHKNPRRLIDLPSLDFFIKTKSNDWWANLDNTYIVWNEATKKFEFELAYFLGVSSISSNHITYNYQLSDGTDLIAKGNKIYELQLSHENADTIPWHNLEYLQVQNIKIIFEDSQQHIFIGDDDGRLIVLKNNIGGIKKVADFPEVGILNAFKEDQTNHFIWIAGSKGLGRFNLETLQYQSLNEKEHNIPNESFYNILIDISGQLWLPGNNGLVRYHPTSKAFHRFGMADGLFSPVFNKNASIVASQTGEIWLGSKNGINVFKPEAIKLLNTKPNIHLSRLLVNDEIYKTEKNLNEQEKLIFNYEQNTLSFEFVALDYSNPNANKFRCQMLGYDKAPIEQGTRNFIRYGNLPAGNYTFKVWGSNSDGVFNKTPLEMGITIIPPFYQTWWFYLLCTLAMIGIIYGVFKYRLEQALKVERLRVKISSDLHDDVGGILSGLAMQTELLERTADEKTKSKLIRIGELSRSAMSRMRDTVWAIDARKDKLEDLVDRMNEHAEETLTPKNFSYTVKIENLNPSTNIPTDIRQNLYLIFKEAITNAAKHSNGDHVNAILKKQDGDFVMRIIDNGKVIAKNYKTTGQGLSNIKMRAKQIEADLSISTTNGYGIILKRKSF